MVFHNSTHGLIPNCIRSFPFNIFWAGFVSTQSLSDLARNQFHGRNTLSIRVFLYVCNSHLPIMSASQRYDNSFKFAGYIFFASLRKAPSVIEIFLKKLSWYHIDGVTWYVIRRIIFSIISSEKNSSCKNSFVGIIHASSCQYAVIFPSSFICVWVIFQKSWQSALK